MSRAFWARAAGLLATAVLVLGLDSQTEGRKWEPLPGERTGSGQAGTGGAQEPVSVGSKPFGESYLLAEIFAQLLEARGFPVERVFGLGGTEIVFQAVLRGEIDIYPEYTGTALVAVLREEPLPTSAATFRRVRELLAANHGLRLLPPLGFNNTFAISTRAGLADSLQLRTISDLAEVASGLVGGVSPDFVERTDGLPGLADAYGLRPRAIRGLLQAVKYEALVSGEVDFIDAYSTDGRLDRYGLTVLDDDLGFFPWYDAAAVVGAGIAQDRPEVVATLTELSGTLDAALVRGWNRLVEVDGVAIEAVARTAHEELGLVRSDDGQTATAKDDGGRLLEYMWNGRAELWQHTLRHLWLVLVSLAAGLALALPLGLALERFRRGAEGIIRAVGVLQTIPGIALLAFMLPLFGIGPAPAIAALFLYSLLPILRNTFTGVRDADPAAVASARALGMTGPQLLRHVRLPLAAPVIMAGVRTAAVVGVGTATLAAFIGAGGLGEPIVTGLALADTRMVLSGAIPAAAMALFVDTALGRAERVLSPKGLD